MDASIGSTLREARHRRGAGLAEAEAATKIRAHYLRAMENEEWDALPGPAYARGFVRAYASYLGLDGERLAEDLQRETGSPRLKVSPRVEPAATGLGERRWPRLSGRAAALAVVAVLIAALVAIGVASESDEGTTGGAGEGAATPAPARAAGEGQIETSRPAPAPRPGVSVRLTAEAEVWVCLLDASERPLVEGEILEPGAEAGPFRSQSFAVAFGNGEVSLLVDGKPATIPTTSSPIGYAIDSEGALTPLAEGERPTCA